MAQTQIGNVHGVVAIAGKNINGGDDASAGFNDANMLTISAMRSRLATIDGAYYTATQLNKMTVNDMIYALRVHDNPTTIR